MKLTTGYKKPIASSGTDALELSSNNSYLLLAGGGHKALSELVSPADLTNYVTIGSDQTITGIKTFSLAINADITGNADTVNGYNITASNGKYFGKIPIIETDGVIELGRYIDFHYDTITTSDYSTRLEASGNHSNVVNLPSASGTLALTSQIPTSLPANGGNADYATSAGSVDWTGVTNRPTSLPANGGNADTLDGLHASSFYQSGYGFLESSQTYNTNWNALFQYESLGGAARSFLLNIDAHHNDTVINKTLHITTTLVGGAHIREFYSSNYGAKFKIRVGSIDNYWRNTRVDIQRVNGYDGIIRFKVISLDRGTIKEIKDTNVLALDYSYEYEVCNIESTTVSNSISADTVDNLHASDFVRAYPTYGTDYSIDSDWGQSIVTFDPVVGGTYPISTPNSTILNLGNDFIRRKQLFFDYSSDNIYFRRHYNSSWTNWVRIALASDIPTSLPANGGNADYATSAGTAETASSVEWEGVTNKPSSFEPSYHTHTTSEITNFPTIGNGALHIKVNGTELTPEGGLFTANKSGDSTIDLANSLATRPEINTLGDKITKIDTSIAGLTAATQIKNPFDDSAEGSEETVETNNEPYTKQLGKITLRFWNVAKYTDLPVYDVFVQPIATVDEPMGDISYVCEIFLIIGITDPSIVSSVGFTPGSYKYFYIRGANANNKVCKIFDVRGNSNINTAAAAITGNYMQLQCHLKLYGGDSGTGKDIMAKVASGDFNAYLCLRQTP